jgi:hypothetical protein
LHNKLLSIFLLKYYYSLYHFINLLISNLYQLISFYIETYLRQFENLKLLFFEENFCKAPNHIGAAAFIKKYQKQTISNEVDYFINLNGYINLNNTNNNKLDCISNDRGSFNDRPRSTVNNSLNINYNKSDNSLSVGKNNSSNNQLNNRLSEANVNTNNDINFDNLGNNKSYKMKEDDQITHCNSSSSRLHNSQSYNIHSEQFISNNTSLPSLIHKHPDNQHQKKSFLDQIMQKKPSYLNEIGNLNKINILNTRDQRLSNSSNSITFIKQKPTEQIIEEKKQDKEKEKPQQIFNLSNTTNIQLQSVHSVIDKLKQQKALITDTNSTKNLYDESLQANNNSSS